MKSRNKRVKSAFINMELSTFEIPPSGDILVLAKNCPIGPHASKRMLDTVAPNQFELIQPEDDMIEALFIKKYLFLRADKKQLVRAIIEEAKAIMGPQCMIRIKCEVVVKIERALG